MAIISRQAAALIAARLRPALKATGALRRAAQAGLWVYFIKSEGNSMQFSGIPRRQSLITWAEQLRGLAMQRGDDSAAEAIEAA